MFLIKLAILIFGVVAVEPAVSTKRWKVMIPSTAFNGGPSNRRNLIPSLVFESRCFLCGLSLEIRGGSSHHSSVDNGVINNVQQQQNDEDETYMGYDFCDDMTIEERKHQASKTSEYDRSLPSSDELSTAHVRIADEGTENKESFPNDDVLVENLGGSSLATLEETTIGTVDELAEQHEENVQEVLTDAERLSLQDSIDNGDDEVKVTESESSADVSVDDGEELNNSETDEVVTVDIDSEASAEGLDNKNEESQAPNSDNNDDDDNNKASNSTSPVGESSGTGDSSVLEEQIITAEVAVEQEIFYETTDNVDNQNSDNFDAWESEVESAPVPDSQTHHLDQSASSAAEAAVAAADLTDNEGSAAIPKDVRAVLIKQLKYRRQEVNVMKPAIAAFVAERSLARPPEGIPHNWYIDGAVPVQSERNFSALAKLRNVVLPIAVGAIAFYFFTASGKADISIVDDVIDKVVSKIKAMAFGKKNKSLEGKERIAESVLD